MKINRRQIITDAMLTSTNVAETDYAAYNPDTTYAQLDRVIVVSADVHQVWESKQAANIGHTPASSPDWWILVGPTNPWKMFDLLINTKTQNADSIAVVLNCPGRVDAVALFNVSAATVRFKMTDVVDGVVYDKTYDLISDSGIVDPYAFCFEPIVRADRIAEFELPPYSDTTLEITLSAPGETVECGACVVGQQRIIGGTKNGFTLGLMDFGVRTRDQWGNLTLEPGEHSDTGRFTVQIERGMLSEVKRLLTSLASIPTVYAGSDIDDAALMLGFFTDFNVVADYGNYATVNIDIESLT